MAQTVHAHLKANGSEIQGESTISTLERENSIECLLFKACSVVEVDPSRGIPIGQRQHKPIEIIKRIDKASPLLAQAMCRNEVIEGTFDFFRPNPAGDGTEQKFYTVEIAGGYITKVKLLSPDSTNPAKTGQEPLEEVAMTYHTITWTYHEGGKTYTDNWRESGVA